MKAAYFLGDHEAEAARLEFQARAWRDITFQLCNDAGIRPEHRVVDLGCGPGFFTFELASIVGSHGQVLAVDKSPDFLATLNQRIATGDFNNISVLCHDIETAPLPHGGLYDGSGRRISAGNMVPAFLCSQGASIVSIKNVSQLAQPNEDLWEWYRQFSFSLLPRLLQAGLITETEVRSYVSIWEERAHTPGAFISVPSHIGIVAEKK